MTKDNVDSASHQIMGYDRAITMFSPDGRLLQVEYAKKTVKQGSTAIGMVCKDGVVFVADKRIIDKLVIPESVEKTFQIDEHIGAAAAGIISDARALIERAQIKAQQHRVTYDSPIDTVAVVKDVCSLKQVCTQSGGLRPFGVSLIIGGIDADGPKLFETDPTGIFFQYRATTIGEGEAIVEDILNKEYNENISIEDGIKLGLKALDRAMPNLSIERADISFISSKDRKFVKMQKDRIEKYFKEIKKRK